MAETMTALVVEDISKWQNEFTAVLEEKHFQVLIAKTLEEAQELYSSKVGEIGLIVMDCCIKSNFPNTKDLVKTIRKSYTGPMIAATGSDIHMQILCEAGCDTEFCKNVDVFRTVVAKIFTLVK
jgi:DNA-binding response OmpR family regulator